MLLIIEALLLISAAVGQDNRPAAADDREILPLDMAENSVDDKFDKCINKMKHRVQTEFLKKEMTNSPTFKKTWKEAEQKHKTPLDNLSKNHSVAIYAYTDNNNNRLYEEFNNAVGSGKQKYKEEKYAYYSLHFWLTDAIQILKKTQTKCYNTYRGTTVEFNKNVKGKEVRFGRFASSSLDRTIAKGFGTKSCFEIKTCTGANVTQYSKYPHQKEVLIPPYETFKVIDVKPEAEQKDPWCETVFILKHYKTRSFLNCAVASSSGNQVAFYDVLLILTVFCNVVSY